LSAPQRCEDSQASGCERPALEGASTTALEDDFKTNTWKDRCLRIKQDIPIFQPKARP